ncbi:hypothetical protein Pla175_20820 [Pirellulimonas nuda]|uniref:Uncharacterized protein n=1 Tax=Pirellulimonas nuda TaxID=2528009 RepID=A0A518DB35_9BACT|nr:hypothetical protein [Pirellulimonas nuda]QDU88701.1 hypothetical protein Pla175_20820 [Pirellulimonas nuda]
MSSPAATIALPAGPAPPIEDLPSDDREARLFWRIRMLAGRTQMRQALGSARLRTSLVVGLSLFFWLGLFLLFYKGFDFLAYYVGRTGAVHAQTVGFVFHVFFASLNVMLVFSSGIILYGSLFHSDEARFLLSQPVRVGRLVLHKFQEAVAFSSWGFMLLATPMTIAYGLVVHAGWQYYLLILPLLASFVYIPCAVGALVCLLLVWKLPAIRYAVVVGAALVMIAFSSYSIYGAVSSPQAELFGSDWFQETLDRFRLTQQQWLPSSWLVGGLLDAAQAPNDRLGSLMLSEHPIVQSGMWLWVLASTALVCHLLVVQVGKICYRQAYSGLMCRDRRPRRERLAWIDRAAEILLRPFPTQVQLILLKDWRLLRRDPTQWTQFLIFFGLLGLYFLNIDRFGNGHGDINYLTWVNLVSFLNLAVVGLILSTFTTRFIFPMLSLEGRRFWVLGLMPVDRETIVLSKFVFAAFGSLVPCAALVLVSDLMLQVTTLVVVIHQLTNLLLCFGLASMAVGLGATMPDFREANPSKIAAGFGGTLNLVLSALYIIVIVVLTALPCHFYLIANHSPMSSPYLDPAWIRIWLVGGAGLAVALGLVATLWPLRAGIKAFKSVEFY